jgi:hypothetical protein
LKKKPGRGSSIGNTGVSSRDEDEDHDEEAVEETTDAEKAMATLKKEWLGGLCDFYNDFVTSNKKKIYVTRVVSASSDANEFAESLIKHFTEIDVDYPIPTLIKPFNSDIKLSLYIMLGKKRKEVEKKDKGGAKTKEVAAKTTKKRGVDEAGLGGSFDS